jgi:GT2 family glycosyltransferase
MLNRQDMKFSIVITTYNRKDAVLRLLDELNGIRSESTEIVVVDNASSDGTVGAIKDNLQEIEVVELPENKGAVGRNEGLRIAKGDYIVTLDDDIFGLNEQDLLLIEELFERNSNAAAICFKVLDFYSGGVCNWCHPYNIEEYQNQFFETTEITEGAVAFRKNMLSNTGLYTEELFISHEGADLAARIINNGYEILYTPLIQVKHKYELTARKSWRRYYFDTRNDFWLVIRNYSFLFGFLHLCRRIPITFIYSLRDGYLYYWLKALMDVICELPVIFRQRNPISRKAERKLQRINRHKPGIGYYLRKRLFSKQIRI